MNQQIINHMNENSKSISRKLLTISIKEDEEL